MIRPRHVPAALLFLGLLLASMISQARSITLSPAVVPLAGRSGQSVVQVLSLRNDADRELEFELEAQDVVVRDGERRFVAAAELPGSIAASAVFSLPRLRVPPHSTARTQVTLTLPAAPASRAVVVVLRGVRPVQAGDRQALMSLGTLFTFSLSERISVRADALEITPPSASADLQLRASLVNDGDEPVVPEGAAAILAGDGRLVGKLPFAPRRLLPGERTTLLADYAGDLAPGNYRVVATLDIAGQPLSLNADLRVP